MTTMIQADYLKISDGLPPYVFYMVGKTSTITHSPNLTPEPVGNETVISIHCGFPTCYATTGLLCDTR